MTLRLVQFVLCLQICTTGRILADDGGTVIVTKDLAEVKVEGNVVGRLGIGAPVWATQFSEDNAWVWVKIPGRQTFGWLKATDATNFSVSTRDQESWQKLLKQNKVAIDSFATDDFQQAQVASQEALDLAQSIFPKLHPELIAAHQTLGAVCWSLGDQQKAQRHFEAALRNSRHFKGTASIETHKCCLYLANSLFATGRQREACDAYRIGIAGHRLESLDVDRIIQQQFVDTLVFTGRFEDAVVESKILMSTFDEGQQATPEYRAALKSRIQALIASGRPKEAIGPLGMLLEKVVDDDDSSIETLADITNTRAMISILLKKYAKAEQLLLTVVELPDLHENSLVPIQCNLALTLIMQDRFDEGEEVLSKALDVTRITPQSLMHSFVVKNQGVLALRKNDLATAEERFMDCLRIRGNIAPNSRDVSEAMVFLADLSKKAMNPSAESDFLQRALAVSVTANGYEHPKTLMLLERTRKAVASAEGDEAAMQIQQKFISSKPTDQEPTYDDLLGPEQFREPVSTIGIGVLMVNANASVRRDNGISFDVETGNIFWALEETASDFRIALAGGDGLISKSVSRLVRTTTAADEQAQIQRLAELLAGYRQANRFKVAYTVASRRLELVVKNPDSPVGSYANLIADVATMLREFGEMDRSAGLLESALPRVRQHLGPNNEWTMKLVLQLGGTYQLDGNHSRAYPLLLKAKDYFTSIHGEVYRLSVESRAVYGTCLQSLRRMSEAESQLTTAAESSIRVNGRDHYVTLDVRQSLALVKSEMGKLKDAQQDFLSILDDAEKASLPDQKFIAIALTNLSYLSWKIGNAVDARDHGLRAINLYSNAGLVNTAGYAMSLNNVGLAYISLGAIEDGKWYLRQSIDVGTRVLGADSKIVAIACTSLGSVLPQNDPQRRSMIERAWDIELKTDEINDETGTILANRGMLAVEDGDFPFARHVFERCVQIESAQFGNDNEKTLSAKLALGLLLATEGKNDEATALFRRVQQGYERSLGELNPMTFGMYRTIGSTLLAKDPPAAMNAFDDYQKSIRHYISAVLPSLSDADRVAFHQNRQYHLQELLSLSPETLKLDSLPVRQLEWLVNGKNTNGRAGTTQANFLRTIPENSSLRRLREIEDFRESLVGRGDFGAVRALDQEEARLLSQITKGAKFPDSDWTSVADIFEHIPSSSLYVDIARVVDHAPQLSLRPQSDPVPEIYVCWVADSEGNVTRHELGNAIQIDEQIQHMRSLMSDVRLLRDRGEVEATQQFLNAADAISGSLLGVLRGRLAGKTELIVSPDSTLWLLPWQALLLDDQQFLIESVAVRTVSSARELSEPDDITGTGAVVFADPDFGEPNNETLSSNWLVLPIVTSLPGTATEAAAILPALKNLCDNKVDVLRQLEASEQRLSTARSPKVLVLSTHGFFLPDSQFQPTRSVFEQSMQFTSHQKSEHRAPSPFSRCGLLLAKANTRSTNTSDDGIVTGHEIVRLNLSGTDLVVLSACETGLGDVRTGESVAGMRQAFHLAGARSVVASLWQVDDRATARLMADFFENLANGTRKSEALRQAQLARINARRERNGAAHPFFWAAFTLTGQD